MSRPNWSDHGSIRRKSDHEDLLRACAGRKSERAYDRCYETIVESGVSRITFHKEGARKQLRTVKRDSAYAAATTIVESGVSRITFHKEGARKELRTVKRESAYAAATMIVESGVSRITFPQGVALNAAASRPLLRLHRPVAYPNIYNNIPRQ